MDYTTMKGKNLTQICKERKIKYATGMSKQEKVEVLGWNDQDNSVDVHPAAQSRITNYISEYRENEEQREKARECSKRWRKNNPEKAREYWIKLTTEH